MAQDSSLGQAASFDHGKSRPNYYFYSFEKGLSSKFEKGLSSMSDDHVYGRSSNDNPEDGEEGIFINCLNCVRRGLPPNTLYVSQNARKYEPPGGGKYLQHPKDERAAVRDLRQLKKGYREYGPNCIKGPAYRIYAAGEVKDCPTCNKESDEPDRENSDKQGKLSDGELGGNSNSQQKERKPSRSTNDKGAYRKRGRYSHGFSGGKSVRRMV